MNKEKVVSLLTAHKYLSSLGVFALLFLLIIVFFFFQRLQQQKEAQSRAVVQPPLEITPSVTPQDLSILTISPKNGTQNVRVSEKIAVNFSRPLSPFEKSGFVFLAKPEIAGTKEWSENNNIVVITPKAPLLYGQKYALEARYADQIFQWSFTTASEGAVFSDITPTPTRIKENPLKENLPLQTTDYTVVFDETKQEIVATLYPKTSSPTPITQQEEQMKSKILLYLENNEIDTKTYPPRWVSKPG